MKGIIIKDIINLRSQYKAYIIILALWFAMGIIGGDNTFFGGIMIMFVVMLPISTMSYDEKNNWNKFALAMPVSRRDIVLAKYLFMGCCLVIIAAISFIGNFIISRDVSDSLLFTFYAFPAGLLINAVLLPMMYKFGVEKGKVIFTAAMLLSAILIIFGVKGAEMWDITGLISETSFNAVFWIVALAATFGSLKVSQHICENKDF